MPLFLYYHPFSSYCQKVLLALYEREIPFVGQVVDLGDERSRGELTAIWPFAKFPLAHDSDAHVTLPESTLIIDYLDTLPGGGPRLIPDDPAHLRAVRLLDRVADNYLQTPLQKIVGDRLRPAGQRDTYGVDEARALLATTYRFLDGRILQNYLCGPDFTLADCAAAPALFYLAKVAPFRDDHPRLSDYFDRLLERPSVLRCIAEAKFFRPNFPAADTDSHWPDEPVRKSF